jgi:hypothetical protein
LPSLQLVFVCNRAVSANAERFLKNSLPNRLADLLQKLRQRRSLSVVLLGIIGLFAAGASAQGTAYYINNQTGSNCSDTGPHSLAKPWCTFGPANHIRTFLPGDQILLARGSSWNQELTLRGRGTTTEPITLSAYSIGAAPKILRNQAPGDICVLLTDASHWKISDLEVGRASVGILLHYTQLFNNGISISNIDAHDNKGIWGGYSTDYPARRHVLDPLASALNVNLSSGILFNVASYLTYTSSQYVLKGVTVSDVRGSNNLDSVAFDAESTTIDNQDGHNTFQDVQLRGLVLSGDNGSASKAYQVSGLGCSDSLRLLGMTNVTVMNSVMFEEAGCHTPLGTAAVILGRVSHVTFANNIIFGVPATGSPDETGIDFEWSEDHVTLQGNLFEANAGPGVEILNIHPGDHSTDLDFDGNTFARNAGSYQPGAASIWEDNKGRGYATPTGKIRNNLYFEPHGRFFAGKNTVAVSNVNNVQTALPANYAAEQFSSTQGKNQWHYQYQAPDSSWAEMPHYIAASVSAWEVKPGQYVSAFTMAPGGCTAGCEVSGVARVWVAARSGIVSIRGHVLRASGNGGTSVSAAINLVSGRNVIPLWPSQGGKQLIGKSDQKGISSNVDNVQVAAGDRIRFEIHSNGENADDVVSWTPSVGYLANKP